MFKMMQYKEERKRFIVSFLFYREILSFCSYWPCSLGSQAILFIWCERAPRQIYPCIIKHKTSSPNTSYMRVRTLYCTINILCIPSSRLILLYPYNRDILTVSHSITVAVAYFDLGGSVGTHFAPMNKHTNKKKNICVYDLRANSKYQMFVNSENCAMKLRC